MTQATPRIDSAPWRRGRFALSRAVTVVALMLVAPWSASTVLAQDLQSLSQTVDRLERQLQTLERNVYRSGNKPAAASSAATSSGTTSSSASGGPPPSADSAGQLNFRIGEIEEQMRQLTGDVERIGFDVRQLTGRLDKLVTDVDFRLRSLEQGTPMTAPQSAVPGAAGAAPAGNAGAQPGTIGSLTESQMRAAGVEPAAPQAAPQAGSVAVASAATRSAAGDSAVALPAGPPSAQYEYAFAFLMRRDFPGAEQAFTEFVGANPEDPLAGNAQYWLGETYYVRNDFAAAARTFAEGFQRYPDSNKAADNLLKLGLSLAALERKQDACITFAKLSTSYPGAASNVLQRAKREREKLGCS